MTFTPIYPEATTGTETLLTYVIQPYPSPLTAMAPQASMQSPTLLPPQALVFLVSNDSGNTVSIDEIQISIPAGSTSSDLTNSADLIVPTFDGGATSMTLEPTDGDPALLTIAGQVHGPVSIGNGDSMILELAGIVTNNAPGVVAITITETSPANGAVPATFQVPVFPFAFYFANLLAYDADSGLPTAQVEYNQAVQLQWDTSVANVSSTTFTVYYSTPSGPGSSNEPPALPVTEYNNWTSPPLTSDTVFTVVAAIAQLQGPDLYLSLSTSVAVTFPDETLNNLTVNGTASMPGGLTVGSPSASSATLTVETTGSSTTIDSSSITVDTVTVQTQATLTSASVSAFQPAQMLLADTADGGNQFYNYYLAGTDGFVIGSVSPAAGWNVNWGSYNAMVGSMWASNSSGATVYATGGVFIVSASGGIGPLQSSLTLPVRNGEQFEIWQDYTNNGTAPPLMYWWFIPSGTGSCTLVTPNATAAAGKARMGPKFVKRTVEKE